MLNMLINNLILKSDIRHTNKTIILKFNTKTRLHSSRMCTARTLTVSRTMVCRGGVYLVLGGVLSPSQGGVPVPGRVLGPGGVPGPKGCLPKGGTWSRGGVCPGVYLVPGGCLPGWGYTWSRGGVCPGGST